MYPEIKKNIIERFLNPLYRYTAVTNMLIVYKDLIYRLPFDVTEDNNKLTVNLGDNIVIDIYVVIEKNSEGKNVIAAFV